MGVFDKVTLKNWINTYIRNNGVKSITGNDMNKILVDIVDSMATGSTLGFPGKNIEFSGSTVNVIDNPTFKGIIKYESDLSGSYDNRTLVDKQYVNTAIDSFTGSTASISIETSARISADTSLSNKINTLTGTTSVTISLESAISTEINTRGSADTSLTTSISSEISTRSSNVTSINSALSTEINTRFSADSSLNTALSSEISTRSSADTSINTRVSTESSSRIAADSSLASSLSTEINTRSSVDSSLNTALSSEVSTRTSADTSLTTSISGEISTRSSNVTSINTRVSTESSSRIAADSSLASSLSSEISTRTLNFTTLSTNINNEISNRTSADVSVLGELSIEITNRISGDSSLSYALDNKTYALSDLTDVVLVDLEDKNMLLYDSVAELWFNDATIDITANLKEGDLLFFTGGTISGTTNSGGAVEQEISARISADNSLYNLISGETSIRTVQISSLESVINNLPSGGTFDPSSLESSISSETSQRISADTSLANAIGSGGGSSSYSGLSYNVITSGGTLNTGATIDFTTSDLYKIDITGNTNIVFDFTNGIIGKTLILIITNSGAGNTTTCSFNTTSCKTIGTYSTVKTNMISVLCVSDTNPKFWVVIGNTTS